MTVQTVSVSKCYARRLFRNLVFDHQLICNENASRMWTKMFVFWFFELKLGHVSFKQWPNFSVNQTFAIKILVMFSYMILKKIFGLVGISKQGYKHKQQCFYMSVLLKMRSIFSPHHFWGTANLHLNLNVNLNVNRNFNFRIFCYVNKSLETSILTQKLTKWRHNHTEK